MIFYFNTCQPEEIFVGLQKNQNFLKKKYQCSDVNKSEKFLNYLDDFIKLNGVRWNDLKGIIAVIGPGSFSSVRLGVLAANALGFCLDIPVIGITRKQLETNDELINFGLKKLSSAKKKVLVMPFYNKSPNITKTKKQW